MENPGKKRAMLDFAFLVIFLLTTHDCRDLLEE
jgi:hypothetical protein